jgi:benzil reductase ((S)-benzoin forming)
MDHRSNNIAYVSGSSRGIGLALCEKLLAEGYKVYGISRTNKLEHPDFTFIQCDLADLRAVEDLNFADLGVHNTVLVNNAGIIGEIVPIGLQDPKNIQLVHSVNTIAPQILMNSFLKATKKSEGTKHIVNISSGAGKFPIDAWGPYCSSKAALDLFSEVLKKEVESRGINGVYIHSVAPGVVDTEMQVEIRSAKPENFLESAKFHSLKENNELSSPRTAADKLFQIIANPSEFANNLVSLRDF